MLGAKSFSISFSLLPGHNCVLTTSPIRTLPGNISELKKKPVKQLWSQCQYENQDHDLSAAPVKSYVSCNFCFLEMPSIQGALHKFTFSSAGLKNLEKALMSSVSVGCLERDSQEASPLSSFCWVLIWVQVYSYKLAPVLKLFASCV